MKRNRLADRWSWILLACGLVTAVGEAQEPGYEVPPVLEAAVYLDAERLRGEHHVVREAVANDGYMNSYTIDSGFGQFEAYGEPLLAIRLREIGALAELDQLSKTKVFADAVAKGAASQVTAVVEFAERPVETVKGVPGGVKRMFKRTKRTVKKGAEAAKKFVEDDEGEEAGEGSEEGDGALKEGAEAGQKYAKKSLADVLDVVDAGNPRDERGYDRVWAKTELYSGDETSLLQSIRLTGRAQLDLAYVDSGAADNGELNVRRFRLGIKMQFRRGLTLHLEGDFDPQDADPFFTRLTDAYLAWSPREALTLTAGKHSVGFTLDGMTSSKRLLTIDRSNLANNIWFSEEYMPGVSLAGTAGRLVYNVGLFSSGDKNRGLGDFAGGSFVLVTLGRDFADRLGAREALLRVNLVDNEPDPDNGFTRPLERIASLNLSYEEKDWGLRADLSAATGYLGQSDLWGFYVMPFRRLSDSLELVGRFTLVESDQENGVRFARYERTIAEGRGDRYDELYLGLNYYLYGHKLKLQNGVQYAEMRDSADDGGEYTGLAWTTALRVSW